MNATYGHLSKGSSQLFDQYQSVYSILTTGKYCSYDVTETINLANYIFNCIYAHYLKDVLI